MPEVVVHETDRLERVLKTFKRKVEQAGILRELRRRRHYVRPSAARQLKSKAAKRARDKQARRKQTRRGANSP